MGFCNWTCARKGNGILWKEVTRVAKIIEISWLQPCPIKLYFTFSKISQLFYKSSLVFIIIWGWKWVDHWTYIVIFLVAWNNMHQHEYYTTQYKWRFTKEILLLGCYWYSILLPSPTCPLLNEFNNANWKRQTLGILNKPMMSFSSWTLKMVLVKHLKFHKHTHFGLIEVWILFDILAYSMLTFLDYSWFNKTFKSLANFSFFPNHQNLAKAKYVPSFLIPKFSWKSFWVPNGHPYPSPKKE
jgi:hypothetical protein